MNIAYQNGDSIENEFFIINYHLEQLARGNYTPENDYLT